MAKYDNFVKLPAARLEKYLLYDIVIQNQGESGNVYYSNC